MRWQFGHGTGRDAVQEGSRLASALGVPAALGRVLWARGYREQAEAERFLEPRLEHLPNPFELKGIEAAVSRVQRALLQGEPICVYGDYDVDGVTSTALLVSVLRKLAGCAPGAGAPARIDYYVPNRLLEGYGLNLEALRRLSVRGTRLLVSADWGVKAVAEIEGEVTCGDVGFKLGPRLNAAGRLSDASIGVRLLLSEDLAEARVLAEQLDRANAERQQLQARIADEAVCKAQEMGDRRALVVSSPGWHVGVVGIVASRLVERFHRPALVLCEDEGGTAKGSGRSIEGVHLYDALARCAGLLTRFGGHRHAAGVTLPTAGVAELAEALENEARERLSPEQLEP